MPASPRDKPGTILILQGGGALGAYECGVSTVLAERLDDLSIIAGTSIGAINAGVIAHNFGEPDRGAAALEAFWRELAFPPLAVWESNPWIKLWGSYQAVATSLTVGNPCLSEVQARMGEIIYQDKTRSDTSGSRWVTWCRELYETLEAIPPAVVSTLERPLRSRRDQLLAEVAAARSRIPVTVTHIHRTSLPYEQISSRDFSMGRVEALIEQGEQDARRAVA